MNTTHVNSKYSCKSIVFFVFIWSSSISFGQHYFDKYENMSEVSAMVMDSNMFRLLSQIDFNSTDPETQEYIKLVENIAVIKVFTTANTTIKETMKVDVSRYLSSHKLEDVLTANENNQLIKLYSKPSEIADHVSELLLIMEDNASEGNQNTVLVCIRGNIDMNQVFKLAQDLDIPGSSILKQAKNKS